MKVIKKPLSEIVIQEDRQRKDLGDITALRESIRSRAGSRQFQDGLINPILLRGDILVAGERRFRAHEAEGVDWIYATDRKSLSQDEAEIFELEENTKRKDLHWTEFAKAVARIHALKSKETPTWTAIKTAEFMGYPPNANPISYALAVAPVLDDKLSKAPTLESAYNLLSRKQQIALSNITNELLSGPAAVPNVQVASGGSAPEPRRPDSPVPQVSQAAPSDSVITDNFLAWAPKYAGPKFSFLHCDFPYGVDIGNSDQMGHEHQDLYEDSPDTYWTLCEALAENIDRILFPSSHVMFWLSADLEILSNTVRFFKERESSTGLVFQSRALIWHKSDNSGVMPDHRRRPRNTYEIALLGSRGDRFILEPVTSSYACPSPSKKLHPSEKPEPMLKHFFRMFINDEASILDPTAGGGSALRAAEDLGCPRVLGLEINPEFASAANIALRQARSKRKLAALV